VPHPVVVIPLLSRRGERWILLQRIPDGLAAGALFNDGVRRFGYATQSYSRALAAAELLASTVVLGTIVSALISTFRQQPHDSEPVGALTISWTDLSLSGMFAIDALGDYLESGRWSPVSMLLSIAMFVMAFIRAPIVSFVQRRRGLTVTKSGLRIGGPLRGFAADWGELESIDIGDRFAVLQPTEGRECRIDLIDLVNERQVRAALGEAEVRRAASGGRL
jgi:hypothetical protein